MTIQDSTSKRCFCAAVGCPVSRRAVHGTALQKHISGARPCRSCRCAYTWCGQCHHQPSCELSAKRWLEHQLSLESTELQQTTQSCCCSGWSRRPMLCSTAGTPARPLRGASASASPTSAPCFMTKMSVARCITRNPCKAHIVFQLLSRMPNVQFLLMEMSQS